MDNERSNAARFRWSNKKAAISIVALVLISINFYLNSKCVQFQQSKTQLLSVLNDKDQIISELQQERSFIEEETLFRIKIENSKFQLRSIDLTNEEDYRDIDQLLRISDFILVFEVKSANYEKKIANMFSSACTNNHLDKNAIILINGPCELVNKEDIDDLDIPVYFSKSAIIDSKKNPHHLVTLSDKRIRHFVVPYNETSFSKYIELIKKKFSN